MAQQTGLGRRPSIALLIAVVSSLGFLAAGLMVPVYTEVTSGPGSAAVTETSKTLVAENGSRVVLLLLFPLLATVVVAIALLGRAHSSAIVLAWSVTGVVAVFNLLAMLTIGIFVIPITIALVVACAAVTAERTASRSLGRETR
jgi:hypothetical protein